MTEPIWLPDQRRRVSNVEHFMQWLAGHRGHEFTAYSDLHRWSVTEPRAFWAALLEWHGLGVVPEQRVLVDASMPGAAWFPDLMINYVDQVLRHGERDDVAIRDAREPGAAPPRDLTWRQLVSEVLAFASWLTTQGVRPGDRVVGYLPNIPEAVVAFLGTASLGAVWASCGQDYAADAAISRLGQLDPVVLVTADGYRYSGRDHDRRAAVGELRSAVRSLRATVVVDRIGLESPAEVTSWTEATAAAAPDARPVQVAFDHPLWVLFSSGTTGKPKGIVHGHGGVMLEHLKQLALHLDLSPGDTYFWYTSPSWMMWNFQVAGLLLGSTIVCYDGSPVYPHAGALWEMAARFRVDVLGTSPAYLQGCASAEVHPAAVHDLGVLRTVGATGSVVPASSYEWVRREIGPDVALASTTGGTDVVSAFAGAVPIVPIWPGELSVPCLGVALEAWDTQGRSVTDAVGEMVITGPLPSMPLRFWDDPDGSRYREAYFSTYPGVWRHGDWITVTDRHSVIVHGRSDATLNRNGVRMGAADIYDVVERIPEVVEALVIGAELPDGGYHMPLFVRLQDGVVLDSTLTSRIAEALRREASPRHVPDVIHQVSAIPHTRTGKKLEIPVKRMFQGATVDQASDLAAVDDPAALEEFARLASGVRPRTGGHA
jgi:acetoacetyl-CoA synthetase